MKQDDWKYVPTSKFGDLGTKNVLRDDASFLVYTFYWFCFVDNKYESV